MLHGFHAIMLYFVQMKEHLCLDLLQESQAISLVSVAHVLGETQHKGFRRQPSHSDDAGFKKADPGQRPQQYLNTQRLCCVLSFLIHTICFQISDRQASLTCPR